MKPHTRVLGFDDGPFQFREGIAPVVGVVMRLPNYVEAVMTGSVQVDGKDSTAVMAGMVNGSRYRDQCRLIMIDGGALGGFNVVDIQKLHAITRIPVATVSRKPPDHDAVERALKGHFDNWQERLDIMSSGRGYTTRLGRHTLHGRCSGIEPGELRRFIKASVVQGAVPEPIRVAHLMAAAVVKGESRGRP